MKPMVMVANLLLVATITVIYGPLRAEETATAQSPDPFIRCMQDIANEPEFASLAEKLPIHDVNNVTFAMLADNTLPSPQERKDILAWFNKRDQCWKDSEPLHEKQWPPEIFQLSQEGSAELHNIGLDLYNRKITFGDANKRLQDYGIAIRGRLMPIIKKYQDEIAAQKETAGRQERQKRAEDERLSAQQREIENARYVQEQQLQLQRRQLFLNYMQATRPPPLQMPSLPPTYNTNCSTFGNQTNCTTH